MEDHGAVVRAIGLGELLAQARVELEVGQRTWTFSEEDVGLRGMIRGQQVNTVYSLRCHAMIRHHCQHPIQKKPIGHFDTERLCCGEVYMSCNCNLESRTHLVENCLGSTSVHVRVTSSVAGLDVAHWD